MNIRSARRSRQVSVDMTPLIDVVFLLLIFFMVSTTFDKQTQLKVDLPEAGVQAEEMKEDEVIAITIDSKGHYYMNNRELVAHDVAGLKHAIRKLAGTRNDMPVIVTSDRQAPFQSVMKVMDAAAQMNLSRLSFVARSQAQE